MKCSVTVQPQRSVCCTGKLCNIKEDEIHPDVGQNHYDFLDDFVSTLLSSVALLSWFEWVKDGKFRRRSVVKLCVTVRQCFISHPLCAVWWCSQCVTGWNKPVHCFQLLKPSNYRQVWSETHLKSNIVPSVACHSHMTFNGTFFPQSFHCILLMLLITLLTNWNQPCACCDTVHFCVLA